MKKVASVLLTCVALLFVNAGCSAKHEPEGELLEQGFAGASGEVKTQVDAALASIKAEKYEEAVDALAKLEGADMTDEQKQAIADVLTDIQNILTDKGGSPELLEKVQNLMFSFY
ncbi:MAG: hypothetical protein RI897_345 [Verrucomicrobiota bacterium]|jgi:thioredoxin-like negative regulator of GroEL